MNTPAHIVDIDETNAQQLLIEESHNRPIVVDFWADWCEPCKQLMPLLEKLADEYAGAFLLAKVNADEQQMLASQLGVRSLFAERVEGRMTLRRGFGLGAGEKVLVVEDVITTGGSVQEVIDLVKNSGAEVAGAAAIVNRSGGRHSLTQPLFSVYETEVVTYQPENCPLCREGFGITKPGSRNLK